MPHAWVLIASLLFATTAWAQRPQALVPGDADTVLERLPRGYAALMPTASSPASLTPAATAARARQLLAAAARSGDARLAARADALLARLPVDTRDDTVLLARAFSAQHRHDFAGALALLDAFIARAPRNGPARLSRAQIQVVRGRLDLARADCAALVLGIDSGDGLLCVAMLSLRNGRYAAAVAALGRYLQAATDVDARRYALVMRAEVAARAGDDDADAWFRRALALAPGDVRTLMAYARYLRDRGRDREIVSLLSIQPAHDGLRLQRTLAAYRLEPRQATALVTAQTQRFAAAHVAGSPPEPRDEAEFLLVTHADPQAALMLAQRNFSTQRDHEDVELLRRAALAAHRDDVLQQLHRWTQSQHLPWSAATEPAS